MLVDVTLNLISDSCIQPERLPRPTDRSVGVYLRSPVSPRDKTYGRNYIEYGGVGPHSILGETRNDEPIVPRSMHHFGGGLENRPEYAKLSPEVMKKHVEENRGFWVSSPQTSAKFINAVRDKYFPRECLDFSYKNGRTMICPRSHRWELEYDQHKPTIPKECRIRSDGESSEATKIDADESEKLVHDISTRDIEQTSTGETTEENEEKAEEPFQEDEWPANVDCYLYNHAKAICCRNYIRREEFSRLHQPFKSDACIWYSKKFPSLPVKVCVPPGKKVFEIKYLSNL